MLRYIGIYPIVFHFLFYDILFYLFTYYYCYIVYFFFYLVVNIHFIFHKNFPSPFFSCEYNLNLDFLLAKVWEYLKLVRVYTKRRGEYPDFNESIIMRNGASVEHVVSG